MKIYVIVVLIILFLSIGCIQKPGSSTSNLTISDYNKSLGDQIELEGTNLSIPEYEMSLGDQIKLEGTIWNKGLIDGFHINISLETEEENILEHIYIEKLKAGESTKFRLQSKYSESDSHLYLKVEWEENGRQNELKYLLTGNIDEIRI